MLDELYQDIILQAARDTQFRGSLSGEPGSLNVRMNNPLCGDSLDLWVCFDRDRIRDVRCDGHGCLISQASANLFAREVVDRPLEEIEALCKSFRSLVQAQVTGEEKEGLGQLTALEGIRRLPARARCALLACEALERILRHKRAELDSADADIVSLGAAPSR
jgi:nitrogen fixation NifU-like protein